MRWCSCLLAFVVPLVLAQTALAQGNDLSTPSGGRAALMGNTGVALARDGAAPFFNPATIVRIQDERLAFAVNFYSLGFVHFDHYPQPGNVDDAVFGKTSLGDQGLLVSAFRVVPSTLCLFVTLRDLAALGGAEASSTPPARMRRTKLALCFASLESEDVDLQALRFRGRTAGGPTSQVQSLQRRWTRTYVGPTVSTYLGPHFAIGASVHAVHSYSSFGLSGSSLSAMRDASPISSTLGTNGSGFSLELTSVLGATYRYGSLTFGASVRVPSLHLASNYDSVFDSSTMGAGSDSAVIASATGSMHAAPPMRAAFGVGYETSRLTLEADGALDFAIGDEMSTNVRVTRSTASATDIVETRSHETYRVARRATFSPSLGAEYFMSPTFSLLSGLSANISSLPPLRPVLSVGNLVQARTHHISASVGLGSYWGGAELLFGLQLDYAFGQALAINPYVVPNNWSVVDTQAYSAMFVISGATDLNAIMRLLRRITSGEEPAPPPAPPAPQPATVDSHG